MNIPKINLAGYNYAGEPKRFCKAGCGTRIDYKYTMCVKCLNRIFKDHVRIKKEL